MQNYFELIAHGKLTRNNNNLLRIPKVRTTVAQNGFFFQGAIVYNQLSTEIRSEEKENLFLSKLKEFNFK